MPSFMHDYWSLYTKKEPSSQEWIRRDIRIQDLPDLPGAFGIIFPDRTPDGYGCFTLNANPLLITVFFLEPQTDKSGAYSAPYLYVGQVYSHEERDGKPYTVFKGKRRLLGSPGSEVAGDEDWTSNRPVGEGGAN
ncbi:MAG TPA: hypothetical protein VN937_21765 [Blastocatellia bacterium]|nr:hypothetical protein [Blastocatellia bacterium]